MGLKISNMGNLRSKDRYRNVCGGGKRFIKGKLLAPTVCVNGYLEAHLLRNGARKVYFIHRLVAMHFIPNPNNYTEVNHKDENPKNCRVDNLEWCTSKYNANYGTRNIRMMENREFKPVNQYTLDGKFLRRYERMADACRETGADISSMIRVCKGRQRTCVGFKWKYAEVV